MKILDLLKVGERKEIGESANIAKLLIENKDNIEDFYSLLLANSDDPIIISHGSYALKEAALLNKNLAKKSESFLFKNIHTLDQWEAKENLLRILLINESNIKLTSKQLDILEGFLSDKSSIVCAYTIEVLIRHRYQNKCSRLFETINWGLSHKKAAVKARTRKIIKELKLNDAVEF